MKKWRINHIAHHGFESEHLLHVPYDHDDDHHNNKNALETWGTIVCLFVCLMNCFKDFPTKEIIKKIALPCELIAKTLRSSDPKKGQEEA
jgi:hypothetical protein